MSKSVKIRVAVVSVLTAAALIAVIIFLTVKQKPYEKTGYAMGSALTVDVYNKDEQAASDTADKIIKNIEYTDDKLSATKDDSDIGQINASTIGTKVSGYTVGILGKCNILSTMTNGAFDITVGSLTKLWNIDGENPSVPSQDAIDKALALVDYTQIETDTDKSLVTKGEGQQLDLGAVGKGAGCDAAYNELSTGSSPAVVSVGGSILLYGSNPNSKYWAVGIRDPEGGENDTFARLSLSLGDGEHTKYISTSGSYEKFFVQDGKTYHHILDPSTGYPAETGIRSVTVVCSSSGFNSDALSTACFVMGIDKSLPVLGYFGAEAVFVMEDGSVYVTSGLKKSFTLTDKDYDLKETEEPTDAVTFAVQTGAAA